MKSVKQKIVFIRYSSEFIEQQKNEKELEPDDESLY